MWVKSEGGQLLNLDYARMIEAAPSQDRFVLAAQFVGNESGDEAGVNSSLFVELCSCDSEPEAHAALDRLGRALDNKDEYLDLNRLG